MDKGPDAFRTISEVAEDLDIPQHVLRFWETRFLQIKPLKRGGGRRYYRPDDVELLKGIRHLLYGEGYTIKGVQRILKEEGVRFVQNAWRGGAMPPRPETGDAEQPELDLPDVPVRADPLARLPGQAVSMPVAPALPAGPEPAGPTTALAVAPQAHAVALEQLPGRLSSDDLRRLQAALAELAECRRILNLARRGDTGFDDPSA